VSKIVYVDMDGTLVDFESARLRVPDDVWRAHHGHEDDIPGVFALMDPMPHAIESYKWLAENFDTYILSTAPWANPTAWSDKVLWVRRYLEGVAHKRLILTHHKDLNRGDFLIDDRKSRGAEEFRGTFVHFGPDGEYPDWPAVMEYMRGKAAEAEADDSAERRDGPA
jgi:FMN phosphatase YigB (HAD superfamily)